MNNKLNLVELEGISDSINAETESQRLASLSSITGKATNEFNKWRQDILNNIALLTIIIDFAEDQELDKNKMLFNSVDTSIRELDKEIRNYLFKVRSSEILLKGIQLVLLGPPNAGKSSILNILANKEAAIVSDIAGTTRDVIDIPLEIQGYKVVLGDTAGIRSLDNADTIEKEGIKRAKAKSLSADFIIVVLDPTNNDVLDLKDHLKELIKLDKKLVIVLNKQDLHEGDQVKSQEKQ
ncbi:unnamed protein product [Candida verbasci]|uniref:TrmE-type G domain-containing protein n=1 Tax=Candida verbasci TaxID=1227364 RepID=A0A9W4TVC5_9ASCO|nr:unnamed protein product [Candida verbasci]